MSDESQGRDQLLPEPLVEGDSYRNNVSVSERSQQIKESDVSTLERTIAAPENCVVGSTVQGWYMRFCVPKLFRLADDGGWDQIAKRVKRYPKEAQFVFAYPPNDTALHRLVRCPGPDQDVMEHYHNEEMKEMVCQVRIEACGAILNAYPAAVSMTNMCGMTPLHVACQNVLHTEGTAQLLLQASPGTAMIQDDKGRTPLHILVSRDDKEPVVPIDLVKRMIAHNPKLPKVPDMNGNTALSLARRNEKAFAHILKYL